MAANKASYNKDFHSRYGGFNREDECRSNNHGGTGGNGSGGSGYKGEGREEQVCCGNFPQRFPYSRENLSLSAGTYHIFSIKVPVLRLEDFFLRNLLKLQSINCRYLYKTLELFNKSNLFKEAEFCANVRFSDNHLPQNSRFKLAFKTFNGAFDLKR